MNDASKVMMKLMHKLLKARARPYYIYMADQVAGGEHFRMTMQKSLEPGVARVDELVGGTADRELAKSALGHRPSQSLEQFRDEFFSRNP